MPDAQPPVVFIILDGYGIAPPSQGNAISLARKPNLDALFAQYPSTQLTASGEAVGLPKNQAGNSEAGHMNIGAGRVVLQDSVRISRSISDGTFFKNPALLQAVQAAIARRTKLHLMGLVSADQSAHADPDHLVALLTLMRLKKVPRVYLHLFTDGRDANPRRGLSLVHNLTNGLTPRMHIASVIGRSYAMDRKKDWRRTKQAYDCLTRGIGLQAPDPLTAVRNAYERSETDEFILPTVMTPFAKTGRITDRDVVIFFNLRSDRARQLTKAFIQPRFNAMNPGSFRRSVVMHRLRFIAMTDFGPDLGPTLTAFPSQDVRETLPVVLSNLKQLYVAETEKYAHMTYFFNGGYDHPIAGEERVVVPSPNLMHYDAEPAMSAPQITDRVLAALESGTVQFIALNYANADMIGHTGNLLATIKAVEILDREISRIAKSVLKRKGLLMVTGDHGNAEMMLGPNGDVHTEHTSNPVPLLIAGPGLTSSGHRLRSGKLGDIAPTLLTVLRRTTPSLMSGERLWV